MLFTTYIIVDAVLLELLPARDVSHLALPCKPLHLFVLNSHAPWFFNLSGGLSFL